MRQLEFRKIDDVANAGRTVVGFQQAARIVDAYGDRAGSCQVTWGREGSRANLADPLYRHEEFLIAGRDEIVDGLQLRLGGTRRGYGEGDVGTRRAADGGNRAIVRRPWHIYECEAEIRLFGQWRQRVQVLAYTVVGVAEVGVVRLALLSLGHIAGGQVVDGVDRTDRPSERDREQRDRHQQFRQRNTGGCRATALLSDRPGCSRLKVSTG